MALYVYILLLHVSFRQNSIRCLVVALHRVLGLIIACSLSGEMKIFFFLILLSTWPYVGVFSQKFTPNLISSSKFCLKEESGEDHRPMLDQFGGVSLLLTTRWSGYNSMYVHSRVLPAKGIITCILCMCIWMN